MDEQNFSNQTSGQPLTPPAMEPVPSETSQTTTTTTTPDSTTITTTIPTAPTSPEIQWPEKKPKNKFKQIALGMIALLLVVGVAGAAYYISNQLSTRQAGTPGSQAAGGCTTRPELCRAGKEKCVNGVCKPIAPTPTGYGTGYTCTSSNCPGPCFSCNATKTSCIGHPEISGCGGVQATGTPAKTPTPTTTPTPTCSPGWVRNTAGTCVYSGTVVSGTGTPTPSKILAGGVCGTGLSCSKTLVGGSFACKQTATSTTAIYCCDYGKYPINGTCTSVPINPNTPTPSKILAGGVCGTGLSCSKTLVGGSFACKQTATSTTAIYCCDYGKYPVNGTCIAGPTASPTKTAIQCPGGGACLTMGVENCTALNYNPVSAPGCIRAGNTNGSCCVPVGVTPTTGGGGVTATPTKTGGGGCNVTSWTPNANTVCTTATVTQTSNCGTKRTIPGTKVCVAANPGACMEISLFSQKSDGTFNTTAMTLDQRNKIKIGDKIRLVVRSNNANLRAKFRITQGTSSTVEVLASGLLNTTTKLTSYYDYTISKAGTYKFEGYVSTSPSTASIQTSCAGVAGIKCPTGFQCKVTSTTPDALGICIPSAN